MYNQYDDVCIKDTCDSKGANWVEFGDLARRSVQNEHGLDTNPDEYDDVCNKEACDSRGANWVGLGEFVRRLVRNRYGLSQSGPSKLVFDP